MRSCETVPSSNKWAVDYQVCPWSQIKNTSFTGGKYECIKLFFYLVDHRDGLYDCPAIRWQFLATALPSGDSFSRLPCHLAIVSRDCPAIWWQFLATALPSDGSFSRLPCHLTDFIRFLFWFDAPPRPAYQWSLAGSRKRRESEQL